MSSSEVEYIIEITYKEALRYLVEFARFLDKHPEDPDFGLGEWLKNLESHIKSCDKQKAVQQGEHIVCVLGHDKQIWKPGQQDSFDLFALPFDILCCRDTEGCDNLEPVFPVDKMLRLDGGPQQEEIWAKFKDWDILVILSYSTEAQDSVKVEAESVIDQFKYALSIGEDKLLRISPEEGEFLPYKLYKERAENARIIWIHNTRRALVTKYLKDLPSSRNLIFYYIGPVEKHALNPGLKYGGVISATKLKESLDLRLGSKIVKLFYVSPHHHDFDRREVFLEHGQPSFVHNLLNDAPRLADLVWFRWSLDEETVMKMTEDFYGELVEPPYCTSQALLAAKSTAYNEWKSDSERYYAWAAPTLITQREHDADHAGADNSIDPDAALRDALRRRLELT